MATRIVKCTIEMELIEGAHFSTAIPDVGELSDEEVLREAAFRFGEIIATLDPEALEEYVQVELIEGVS